MTDIQQLESIDLEEGANPGDVLLGTIFIADTPMHLTAIRLNPDSDIQEALNDPYDRMAALWEIGPDARATTDLSKYGFEGEYVIYADPQGV